METGFLLEKIGEKENVVRFIESIIKFPGLNPGATPGFSMTGKRRV
jgi:hypothetical protein